VKGVKGRDFVNQAIQKAIDWNHGTVPEIGIRYNFVYNELVKHIVVNEKELRDLLDIPELEEWSVTQFIKMLLGEE